ncbi:hypothetical protein C2G38_2154893 [Gigaspora rosea]|uniref:Uncharacterized protein n=1 Tax=Gigaspora rosea TaxID=44941 RepID=A0A397WAL6_9GLOM|nr:hypothetical protein C2G38_2154893 [Gigaspora rosea]
MTFILDVRGPIIIKAYISFGQSWTLGYFGHGQGQKRPWTVKTYNTTKEILARLVRLNLSELQWDTQTKTYSFSYEIIQEGYYPLSPILAYTFPPNKYKIPDKYIVKTTFGKRSNQQIIKCSINYINNKPLYHIEFEDQIVESKKSASEAANLYQDALNKIAQLKNPYKLHEIFGLQLQNIKKIRENKHRNHSLKPFNQLANSSQKMRGQRFGIMIKDFVDQNSKTLFNSEDNVLLKQVLFIKSIIYAMDRYKITREALRSLTGIEHHLPREWLISEMRAKITAEISQAIKVYTFDLEESIDDEHG